jgi:hypothetical protein
VEKDSIPELQDSFASVCGEGLRNMNDILPMYIPSFTIFYEPLEGLVRPLIRVPYYFQGFVPTNIIRVVGLLHMYHVFKKKKKKKKKKKINYPQNLEKKLKKIKRINYPHNLARKLERLHS